MITEEEIKVNLKILSNVMLNFEDALCDRMQEKVKEVKEYIEHLEKSDASKEKSSMNYYNKYKQLKTEKQNVIKDLEKLNNSLEKDGFVGYADDIQEILSYMKGEEK